MFLLYKVHVSIAYRRGIVGPVHRLSRFLQLSRIFLEQ